jgi:SAM-dependent MidA family methyltransferase
MESRPWRDAWHDALYGPDGFYRRPEGPAGHFLTSTHGSLGAVFAGAVAALADREGVCRVVDIACGRGELLAHLHAARPDLGLLGVDVVERPAELPESIGWVRSPGAEALPAELDDLDGVLVLAHEWLDVVPCTVAEIDADGALVEVLVDPETGAESLGAPLDAADAGWVERWWPLGDAEPGDRVEVGLRRDLAWTELLSRVRAGAVLAVDYGHTRASRPTDGTLTAYRAGQATAAVPDGTCDITAHVAVDSLAHDELTTQRDALRALGVSGARPDLALARSEPAAYLAALAGASTAAALTDPAGLGGFWWVLRRVAR